MSGFFGFLAFVLLICFIIGMIKPKLLVFWSKNKSRKAVCLYLIPLFLFFIISVATAKDSGDSTKKVVASVTNDAYSTTAVTTTMKATTARTEKIITKAGVKASTTTTKAAGKVITATRNSSDIKLVGTTRSAEKGENVTIKIQGKPNTEYSISVRYASGGLSKAKGLDDKKSDSSGYVSWTWKIGAKTASGTVDVDILGGGQTLNTTFEVR